jgi:hypothetical protein
MCLYNCLHMQVRQALMYKISRERIGTELQGMIDGEPRHQAKQLAACCTLACAQHAVACSAIIGLAHAGHNIEPVQNYP